MLTAELVPMVRRDLLDFQNEYEEEFLSLKIADTCGELFLFLSGYTLSKTQTNEWQITPDPPIEVQRLISIITAIDIILTKVATIQKIAEEIKEPGLSYAYRSSALALKVALEELYKKRDRLLSVLKGTGISKGAYYDLIQHFQRNLQWEV